MQREINVTNHIKLYNLKLILTVHKIAF